MAVKRLIMNNTYAPIILFAYNRPWHTEQVLNALKNNELADKSHLIIYVDGPKANANSEQIQKIEEVKQLVQNDMWCASVEYHFAEKNIGCRDSIIQGITQVLKRYEAAIILEDDIVTSPFFLKFMNRCIDFYRNFEAVFSISGTTLPENLITLPRDYKYDVYVSLRQLNSGWATWSNRWNQIDWNLNFVSDFINQKHIVESFSRGGDDLIPMLIDQVEGRSDAWDIQFTYNQFIQHAVSILPRFSYIVNIGGDGSGTHHFELNCNSYFDLSKSIQDPNLLDVIYEDKRIINMFYNAYCFKRFSIWKRIINHISRQVTGKKIFVKKNVYV